jgi:hypothetical protein
MAAARSEGMVGTAPEHREAPGCHSTSDDHPHNYTL